MQATLTDDLRPVKAMARLRERFPHTLALAFEPSVPAPFGAPAARPTGRADHDVALDFVADLRGTPATTAEAALLRDAVDACCEDPDVDALVGDA